MGIIGTNAKKGDPADIAAMMSVRGPPKKKRRTTIASTESSVVPFHEEAPASSMRFPPSQNIDILSSGKEKKLKKGTSSCN